MPVRLLSVLRRRSGRGTRQRLDGGRLFDWMYDAAQHRGFMSDASGGGGVLTAIDAIKRGEAASGFPFVILIV